MSSFSRSTSTHSVGFLGARVLGSLFNLALALCAAALRACRRVPEVRALAAILGFALAFTAAFAAALDFALAYFPAATSTRARAAVLPRILAAGLFGGIRPPISSFC